MTKLVIFSLIFISCSYKNSNDNLTKKIPEPLAKEIEKNLLNPDTANYFYFHRDNEFLCLKKNGRYVDLYKINIKGNQNSIKRFRGEEFNKDTVYLEQRDYNQFDNNKNILFESGMGVMPDALKSIKQKLNTNTVKAYLSFNAIIDTLKKSYDSIDSNVFNKKKETAIKNRIFPFPKYLHLVDKYYSSPSAPFDQKVDLKVKNIGQKSKKYFVDSSGQFLPIRIRAIVKEDGRIEITKIYQNNLSDEQQVLIALVDILKNTRVKNYSILNTPIKAEIFLTLFFNE